MNAIRNSNHIRTHRELKGFHACLNSTGAPQILPELGRVRHEASRRLNRARLFAGQRPAQPKGA